MLVSAEESGKYFLLGEKCTSNGQLWVIFIRFFFITVATTISVGYLATKIALILELFVNRFCWTVFLGKKTNSDFYHQITPQASVGWCKKLTKAKRKRLTR